MDSEKDSSFLKMLESLSEAELVPESAWEMGMVAIEKTFVPEIPAAIERPSEASDFKDYLENVESKFKALEVLMQKLASLKHNSKNVKKKFVVSLIILCGEHSKKDNWTTEATINYSVSMLNHLCHICVCKNVTDLLTGNDDSEGLFGPVLLALRPKLLKSTWKTFPSAITCYHWMLKKVKSPYLSCNLNNILPTALILVDDFVPDNIRLGITCLHHIVDNVTRTELGWYGQGEVIYKSLEVLMHRREPELLPALCYCLAAYLEKVESGYKKNEGNFEWSHHDDVLEILLNNMEMEQGLALRKAYVSCLPSILQTARLRACRWNNSILRVLKEYMEVSGHYHQYEEAWFALKALQEWITNCWPVVHHHTELLLQSLLRLIYDFSTELQDNASNPSRDQILALAEKCLMFVVKLAPEEANILCQGIKEKVTFNSVISSIVERVFVD